MQVAGEDLGIEVQQPAGMGETRISAAPRAFCRWRCFGLRDEAGFESGPVELTKIEVADAVDGRGKLRARRLKSRSGRKTCGGVVSACSEQFANRLDARGNDQVIGGGGDVIKIARRGGGRRLLSRLFRRRWKFS